MTVIALNIPIKSKLNKFGVTNAIISDIIWEMHMLLFYDIKKFTQKHSKD